MMLVAPVAPPRAAEGAPRTPPVITNTPRIVALRLRTYRESPRDRRGASPGTSGGAPSFPAAPQGPSRASPGPPMAQNTIKTMGFQWFPELPRTLTYAHGPPEDPPSDLPGTPRYPQMPPKVPSRVYQLSRREPSGTPRAPRDTPGTPQRPPLAARGPPGPPQMPHGAPGAASALPRRRPEDFKSCSGRCQINTLARTFRKNT